MTVQLKNELFINNQYTLRYGNREALFIIVDEEFKGNNNLARVNRIVILIREYAADGQETDAVMCTTVIGLGDGFVGVKTEYPELRGKLLTHENMELCEVELYEDE